MRRFKFRGSSGKVNLALDGLPDFTCLPGRASTCAARSASARRSTTWSAPTTTRNTGDSAGALHRHDHPDPRGPVDGAARQARHELLRPVRAVPPRAGARHWDDQRDAFGDAVIDPIAERAPNIRDLIVGRQVLTPLDIERTVGLTEGNIFQGELSLEQLFFNRPVPGYARFRTPVRDLWLCGSATHPGGGIMGANGRIAALEMLRARGRKAAWAMASRRRVRRRRMTRSSSGRSQRPRHRGVPRQRRASDRDPRAARGARWCGGHARSSPRACACRPSPTPSGDCGRPSSATSISSATGCRSSRPTCGCSRRSATATRSRSGPTRPRRPRTCAPGRPPTPAATPTSTGWSGRWRVPRRARRQAPPDIARPGSRRRARRSPPRADVPWPRAPDARTITRVLPMAVADFVAESFETDAVRAVIATRGVRYTALGPWSAGTTAILLADSAGNDGGAAGQTVFARGGPGALADAARAAAVEAPAEIRTGAEVTRSPHGRPGHRCRPRPGEEIPRASSSPAVDPKRTLTGSSIRSRSARASSGAPATSGRPAVAKVNLALPAPAALPRGR